MDSFFAGRFRHYLTGVERLDHEHRKILELMHDVENNPTQTPAELATKVTKIAELFRQHLVEEEQLMIEIDYPYVVYHAEQHAEILRMVTDYENTPANFTVRYATRRLSDHFLTHIDHYDFQFANYVKRALVSAAD